MFVKGSMEKNPTFGLVKNPIPVKETPEPSVRRFSAFVETCSFTEPYPTAPSLVVM
jgi:hypothetical protein